MAQSERANTRGGGRAPIDIWIGTTLGILKGASLSSKQCTNFLPGSLSLSQIDKSKEICVMCWEYQSQEKLYAGLRNGKVQCFNCIEKIFTTECDCTGGEGTLVGLEKHEDVLTTCTDRGKLSFWPPEMEKSECLVGSHASCMAANAEELMQVATGGKENDLKLWDGNRLDAGPLFQAKNVRHDSLDLRVPVWVTEVGFTPGSGTQPTVAVGTGYHQVRLYDTRAQRRPIYSTEFGDSPVTALTVLEDGRSFVVGNSVGDLARFDLRKGSVVNRYKGFAGGVCSVQCCSDGSLLAACGLDRFLRVFTVQPPRLQHQVYLKLQSNCLLFSDERWQTPSSTEAQHDTTIHAGQKHLHPPPSPKGDSSDEELWAAMETVEDKCTISKKRVKRSKGSKQNSQNPGLEASRRTKKTISV